MQEMQDDNGIHMARAKAIKREYPARETAEVTPETTKEKPKPVVVKAQTPTQAMKPMRLLIGGVGKSKVTGPVTGQAYIFRPGEVTYVDISDYDSLLARRTNPKRCCGGKSPAAPQQLYGPA